MKKPSNTFFPFTRIVLERIIQDEAEHYENWCIDNEYSCTEYFLYDEHVYAQARIALDEINDCDMEKLEQLRDVK